MHELSAEVLQTRQRLPSQLSKPSQSPRRHPKIVPDSASETHRSFRFSQVMRVPCCHVAPLYHVTSLPTFILPVSQHPRTSHTDIQAPLRLYLAGTIHCVRVLSNPIIVIAVENGGPSHGESPLFALHARTDSAFDGRFQDQTKRERVCMTNPRETHDGRRV